ncbi:MAG: hypothetical protein DMG65_14085 [Candidatus Angelobacter sp. Gp1-AA117]|nr:MAG: hypothetical protein DMG65_14085 [Candidatus Angelobacter sp. Gp1-AA117]
MKSRIILVLLGILTGIGAVAIWTSGVLWWPLRTKPAATTTSNEGESYKEKLELYGKRADDLERLLSLLLAGSTIYALAVGYNAYQQSKDTTKKLEDLEKDLKDLKSEAEKHIEQLQSRITRSFPLFTDLDFAISTTTNKILRLFPHLDLSEQVNLSAQEKQQILFYEKATAAFEFFETHSLRAEISGIYRGLGNFYARKFKQDSAANPQPSTLQDDKDRALFYLNYAIQQDDKNSNALNDRGYFALEIEQPAQPVKAKGDFLSSLKANPEQQRARYNLALIEHRAGNFNESIRIIDLALEKKNWQEEPIPERVPDLRYNRACSLACAARQVQGTKQDAHLESAMSELEKIATAAAADWKNIHTALEADLKTKQQRGDAEGDLTLLLHEQTLTTRLKNVRDQIAAKA